MEEYDNSNQFLLNSYPAMVLQMFADLYHAKHKFDSNMLWKEQ